MMVEVWLWEQSCYLWHPNFLCKMFGAIKHRVMMCVLPLLILFVGALAAEKRPLRGPRGNETERFRYESKSQPGIYHYCDFCEKRALDDSTYNYMQVPSCLSYYPEGVNWSTVLTPYEYNKKKFPFCNVGETPGCGPPPEMDNIQWECEKGYSGEAYTVYFPCKGRCNGTEKFSAYAYCSAKLKWEIEEEPDYRNSCIVPEVEKKGESGIEKMLTGLIVGAVVVFVIIIIIILCCWKRNRRKKALEGLEIEMEQREMEQMDNRNNARGLPRHMNNVNGAPGNADGRPGNINQGGNQGQHENGPVTVVTDPLNQGSEQTDGSDRDTENSRQGENSSISSRARVSFGSNQSQNRKGVLKNNTSSTDQTVPKQAYAFINEQSKMNNVSSMTDGNSNQKGNNIKEKKTRPDLEMKRFVSVPELRTPRHSKLQTGSLNSPINIHSETVSSGSYDTAKSEKASLLCSMNPSPTADKTKEVRNNLLPGTDGIEEEEKVDEYSPLLPAEGTISTNLHSSDSSIGSSLKTPVEHELPESENNDGDVDENNKVKEPVVKVFGSGVTQKHDKSGFYVTEGELFSIVGKHEKGIKFIVKREGQGPEPRCKQTLPYTTGSILHMEQARAEDSGRFTWSILSDEETFRGSFEIIVIKKEEEDRSHLQPQGASLTVFREDAFGQPSIVNQLIPSQPFANAPPLFIDSFASEASDLQRAVSSSLSSAERVKGEVCKDEIRNGEAFVNCGTFSGQMTREGPSGMSDARTIVNSDNGQVNADSAEEEQTKRKLPFEVTAPNNCCTCLPDVSEKLTTELAKLPLAVWKKFARHHGVDESVLMSLEFLADGKELATNLNILDLLANQNVHLGNIVEYFHSYFIQYLQSILDLFRSEHTSCPYCDKFYTQS